jgi:hypothetical protein
MNRKALVEYLPQFIMRVIFLIVVLTAILFLINSYIKTEVHTFDAEASLFIQRVLYSKNCLAYHDETTGQTYPGIIEYASLASEDFQEQLAGCANYRDSRHLAARIEIFDEDNNSLLTHHFNKQWYEHWIELVGFPGFSGSQSMSRTIYILLKDRREIRMRQLQDEIDSLKLDSWARDIVKGKQAELDRLRDSPSERDLLMVPGYLKITVVMPNS